MSTITPSRKRERRTVLNRGSFDLGYVQIPPNPPTYSTWPITLSPLYWLESCQDETHPGPPFKSGGPLDIWKKTYGPTIDLGTYEATIVDANGRPTHVEGGKFRPAEGWLDNPSITPTGWLTTWGDGSSYGATGWNKFKPGKPGADLSVFLAELRDLPRMFKFRLRSFKDLGSQYLNYQFGWRPFLNDLRKFLDTTQKLAKRFEFLRRNNGKPLRRGGTVKMQEESNDDRVTGTCTTPSDVYFWSRYPLPAPASSFTRRSYYYQRIWFEAVFQFWIPDLGTPDWISRATRRMYGLNLSPSVVWELIPWSWLVDWFTNVGDVMSNLSDSDAAENLVARYAYIMAHTIQRYDFFPAQFRYYTRKVGLMGPGTERASGISSWYIQYERKQRAEACPYGFGLTWDGLSLRQLAILAALGITRGT